MINHGLGCSWQMIRSHVSIKQELRLVVRHRWQLTMVICGCGNTLATAHFGSKQYDQVVRLGRGGGGGSGDRTAIHLVEWYGRANTQKIGSK